jgi:hypothetical protein
MLARPKSGEQRAAYYYRKGIEFVRTHPEQYDPEFETTFRTLVDELDPPSATS